jgi:hypothetical protein
MNHLMIHDIRKEYFDLNLNAYRLTFDDGLFSQYYYFSLFQNHPQQLHYFIVTSLIQPGKARAKFNGTHIVNLKPAQYMHRTIVDGNYDHFMTVAEIQELGSQPNVRIGVHSHFHDVIPTRQHPRKRKPLSQWKLKRFENIAEISTHDLSIRSKLAFQGFEYCDGSLQERSEAQWEDYIKRDTELCIKWVEQNLGFTPDMYCFPFNEHNEKLLSILKEFGFTRFFSARPGEFLEIQGRIDIDKLAKSKELNWDLA